MATLIIAVVVSTLSGINLWGYIQYIPLKYSPKDGMETYSKYDFSFVHSRGMIISEYGFLDNTATNTSGIIISELIDDEYGICIVVWMTVATDMPLKSKIEVSQGMMDVIFKEPIMKYGELLETTAIEYLDSAHKHQKIIRYYTINTEGEVLHGVYGVWYCDTSQRLYVLYHIYKEEKIPEMIRFTLYSQSIQKCLHSFVCHK